jgi:hypothetical protein
MELHRRNFPPTQEDQTGTTSVPAAAALRPPLYRWWRGGPTDQYTVTQTDSNCDHGEVSQSPALTNSICAPTSERAASGQGMRTRWHRVTLTFTSPVPPTAKRFALPFSFMRGMVIDLHSQLARCHVAGQPPRPCCRTLCWPAGFWRPPRVDLRGPGGRLLLAMPLGRCITNVQVIPVFNIV